ncbi:helix-turn-helix transcriptional regulator [Massilia sp.]|uniref:helix-turn-helix transcriptional regulator n=1 Tax=Massilia sp. TaxID=1882437 RepID=UPI00391CE9A6
MKKDSKFQPAPSQGSVRPVLTFNVGGYVPQYKYKVDGSSSRMSISETVRQVVQELYSKEASTIKNYGIVDSGRPQSMTLYASQCTTAGQPNTDGEEAGNDINRMRGKWRAGSGERHRFLRMSEVCKKVGLARSTIYKLLSLDAFPPQIPIGPRAVAFLEQEVDEWMAKRVGDAS